MLLPKLEEIKKIRIQLGLTKTVLAKQLEKNKTKVSRMLLYMIEEKNHSPNYKIAEAIFKTLDQIENSMKNKGITAGEICARDLVTVRRNEKVITAKKRMGQQGEYTHLPVLNKGECVGLITSNSILKNPNAVKVKNAMEGRPTIIDEDLVITEGIEALLSNTQSCILVSHRNSSKIMGIIVAWDLIPKKKENMKQEWKRKGQKRV